MVLFMCPKCHQRKCLPHSTAILIIPWRDVVGCLLPPATSPTGQHVTSTSQADLCQNYRKDFLFFENTCELKRCCGLMLLIPILLASIRIKAGNDTQQGWGGQSKHSYFNLQSKLHFLSLPDSSQNNLLVQKFRYLSFTTEKVLMQNSPLKYSISLDGNWDWLNAVLLPVYDRFNPYCNLLVSTIKRTQQ